MLEHFTDLDDQLCIGSHPHAPEHITALAGRYGVRGVVNLQSDADLRARGLDWSILWQIWTRAGVSVQRVPITDFDPADLGRNLDAAVAAIQESVEAGRKTFVHCNAGLNRSPSAAIAWVALNRGLDLESAGQWVGERHRSIPYDDVLRAWARRAGVPLQSSGTGS